MRPQGPAARPISFGWAVAVAGATAVVGTPTKNEVAIFTRSAGRWRQTATIADPHHSSANVDSFGSAVSVSGNTLVVGAYDASDTAGAAYIFGQSHGKWRLQAALPNPHPASIDQFGYTVGVSAGTAVIGALSGGARIYARAGSTWTLQDAITGPAGFFGTPVTVSGATVIVGGSAAAYVYGRTGSTWRRKAEIIVPGGGGLWSAAMIGSLLVLGSPGAHTEAGAAFVYQGSGGSWHLQAALHLSDAVKQETGWSVAISRTGSTIRVFTGAPHAGRKECGAAYEFVHARSGWSRRATVADPGCSPYGNLGWSVALEGRTAFVGSPSTGAYLLTLP